MSLNRDVCFRCQEVNPLDSKGPVPIEGQDKLWGEDWKEWREGEWDNNMVFCFAKVDWINIHNPVPDECYFHLEQVVSQKSPSKTP